MRRILTFLFISAALVSNAQTNLREGIDFKIACGFAGITSLAINNVQHLVQSKNYILLRQSLFNETKIEAVLSVIALQHLQQNNSIHLSEEELKRMDEISNWKDHYSICYTCTQQFEGTVNELLAEKSTSAYLLIRSIIFKKK